jgi:predicted nucleic acid-binding protein
LRTVTATDRYLLDATVLIDISKEHEPISSRVYRWLAELADVGVCGVVVTEFFAGLQPEQRLRWETFVERLAFWVVTPQIAMQAGIYRYVYARRGTTVATTDAIIAATAVSVGATLVTGNVKDFPMPELSLMPTGR